MWLLFRICSLKETLWGRVKSINLKEEKGQVRKCIDTNKKERKRKKDLERKKEREGEREREREREREVMGGEKMFN